MTDVAEKQLALARHFSSTGQPQRVLEALDGGDGVDDPSWWLLRANALYDLDRCAEGAEAARRGLELSPGDPVLLDALALNLIELDELADAERALLAALELWPDDEVLLSHYALACARAGDARKARALVERAAQLDPDSVDVARTRAQVAWLTGEKSALDEAERVLELDPEDRVAHLVRGNVLVEREDVYGAVAQFDRAARLDPSDRDVADVARYNRALTHWSQWPIYPIVRFGPLRVWGAYLVFIALVNAADLWSIAFPIVVLYVAIVVYSWTVAPAARWWLRRSA